MYKEFEIQRQIRLQNRVLEIEKLIFNKVKDYDLNGIWIDKDQHQKGRYKNKCIKVSFINDDDGYYLHEDNISFPFSYLNLTDKQILAKEAKLNKLLEKKGIKIKESNLIIQGVMSKVDSDKHFKECYNLYREDYYTYNLDVVIVIKLIHGNLRELCHIEILNLDYSRNDLLKKLKKILSVNFIVSNKIENKEILYMLDNVEVVDRNIFVTKADLRELDNVNCKYKFIK